MSGPLDHETRRRFMLWTITILLVLMWLLGMVTNYTLGGFIHILLLLAIVSVLVRVIQGRNPI
jgi:asparagine N-glycosylation enzyme membrane subunit Stt3